MNQCFHPPVSEYKISWGPYTDQLACTKHRVLIIMIRVFHLGNDSPTCNTSPAMAETRNAFGRRPHYTSMKNRFRILFCVVGPVLSCNGETYPLSIASSISTFAWCLASSAQPASTRCCRPQIVCWMTDSRAFMQVPLVLARIVDGHDSRHRRHSTTSDTSFVHAATTVVPTESSSSETHIHEIV